METKHTPGPWFVMNTSDVFTGLAAKAADGRRTHDSDGWHIADCANGGSYVDDSTGLHELSLDEIKANARLIAAAPELLQALKHIDDTAQSDNECDPGSKTWGAILAARPVTAKAEGK